MKGLLGKKPEMRDVIDFVIQEYSSTLPLLLGFDFSVCRYCVRNRSVSMQEAGRRGLVVFWATISLQNCGLAARPSSQWSMNH